MATPLPCDPAPVNVRLKISALWTAMLFVFVYVDLFSLYRPDFRADLEAGRVAAFDVTGGFLLGVTAYIVVASLMVALTLLLPAHLARMSCIALAMLYAVTIGASAIGEWGYFVLGSVVELVLLVAIVVLAWRWPRLAADG